MTLDEILLAHKPIGETEEADLARIRALLAVPDPWDRTSLLHVTASALVVHPPSRRVLLRWHPRQDAWIQVGGHADPGESDPLAIALREAREETGLVDVVPWSDPALVHVAVVRVPANDVEPAHEHADLRFVFATERPGEARPEKPDAPLRWVTLQGAAELTAEDNVGETLRRIDFDR